MTSSDAYELGFPISQINGCRRFGPKLEVKNLNPPPRGSEIFVARIPQSFSHQELLNIFVRAGEVYDVRLMLDFMKKCKGFAFVRFMKPEIALKAIEFINRYRIYHEGRSSRLVAMVSTDHRTLVLTGCPAEVSRQEVQEYFQDIAEDGGLENVTVEYQQGLAAPIFNLLFATHRAAALMKKSDWSEGIPRRWGPWVRLNWQPNEEVDQRRRFKQERQHFMSLMGNSLREDNRAIIPTIGFNPLSLASGLSGLGQSGQPAASTLVRPLTTTDDNAPTRAPGANAGSSGSGLNVFAPTFKLNEGQRKEAHLLSPQQFLSPRSSSNVAQFEGFSEASSILQNTFSGNSQRLLWEGGNCPPQLQAAGMDAEPEGAWGGAPLRASSPALGGFEGNNTNREWGFNEPSSSFQDFAPEPYNAVGGFSMLQKDEPMAGLSGVGRSGQSATSTLVRPLTANDDNAPTRTPGANADGSGSGLNVFAPSFTKPAVAKKPVAAPAKKAKSSEDSSDEEDEAPTTPSPQKRKREDNDDGESVPAKVAAKTPAPKDESSDSDESDEEPAKPAVPAAGKKPPPAAAKPTAKKESSSDDSSSDQEPPKGNKDETPAIKLPPKLGQVAPKPAPKKADTWDSDSDSSEDDKPGVRTRHDPKRPYRFLPYSIFKMLTCQCKTCGVRCECFRAGISCTNACGVCRGFCKNGCMSSTW